MSYCPIQRRLVGGVLWLWTISAYAQTPVALDAGILRQQMESHRPPLGPSPWRPAEQMSSPSTPPDSEGLNVDLKQIRVSGNALISAEKLQEVLAPFLGEGRRFDDLQRAAQAVAAAYRREGWVAQVLLPEQDITEGVVTLQVLEARLGSVQLEGPPPRRVQLAEIKAYIHARLSQGQALNAGELERALLLADDLPGVAVAGTLVPGSVDGDTDLVLQTTDEPGIRGELSVDNTGSRSLGSERATLNFQLQSPWGRGELIGVNLMHSEGSAYGRLALTVPVAHHGWRLGVNASDIRYRVVNGPSAGSASRIRGGSSSLGADLNLPLVRSRQQTLMATAALDAKSFLNQDTQIRSDYASHSLRLGLSGQRSTGQVGTTSGSVHLVWGRLTDMQAHPQLGSIPRAYRKVSYQVSHQQWVLPRHSLGFSIQGQHASQVLDTSERFYIGGSGSVRAYPSSEQGGERGAFFSTDWRWRLQAAWEAMAFVDLGEVRSVSGSGSGSTASVTLRGAGLGLNWRSPSGLTSQLIWARRLGSNPRPTASMTDGDGTLVHNRLWLTTSLSF